jgi:predicted NBD/HSP70 family sugar kinase
MKEHLIGRHSLLKTLNHRAVLELVAQEGPQSRVEIAERLTLSPASVSRVVEGLLQAELLKEGERIASRAGRRQTLLDVNPSAGIVGAVDIRSRKMRIRLADLKGNKLLQRIVATPTTDAEALASALTDIVQDSYASLEVASPLITVAVGISAAWDAERQVVYAAPNLPFLEGVEFNRILRKFLNVPCLIDNDVNYAALGEHTYGAARGHDDFFYLNIGSGVGGSAIIHGRLHRGVQGFAGEIGFLPLFFEEAGAYQNLESLISRGALVQQAERLGVSGDPADLLTRVNDADTPAATLMSRFVSNMAVGLCAVITVLNPSLIVIGGSLGRHSEMLISLLEASIERFLPLRPPIAPTQLREDAPLQGGISQAIEHARLLLVERQLSNGT